jgi:hypothetical protein
MAGARGTKRRRSPARAGGGRPGTPEDSLAILARRTSELFVELARLSARLERLEDALRDVREECAKMVQRRLRRLLQARRREGGPRGRASRPPRLSAAAA